MASILHIDTAGNTATVMLAASGIAQPMLENKLQNEHAAFLHPAIETVLQKAGIAMNEIDAVAVANGPGSYTGLRVGLAAAKGICYALNKPLICINNLEILAAATRLHTADASIGHAPMIDARRMEVFTALYNSKGELLISPHAEVLNANSFSTALDSGKLIFSGSGADKWQQICRHPNALFSTEYDVATAFASLAHDAFMTKKFADLAYVEPFYLKEFYFGQ